MVPKKQHGSYRLIHHLSHPTGSSINDNIPQELCTVQYQTIENAIAHIRALWQGCFMAKTDIAEAFRIIPVLPAQYQLFGLCWRGQYYYDKCLAMGCSSSCQIFERLSSALQWIATHKLDIQYISHVLGDFIILNNAYDSCKAQLQQFLHMCADIGVPMAEEKTFLPTQVLSFWGYELDSVKMEVRLPSDKLEKCLSLIQEFLTKPKFTLKTLQSIIGTLNFACAVVLPGRAFLRRLIDLTIGVSKPHYFIRITKEVREDLHMWAEFLANFNGRTIFMAEQWLSSTSLNLFTDASGTLGYGAVLGSSWFYGTWSQQWVNQNITLLELYPIVLAVQIWGSRITNGRIIFHTDNQALVPIINKQSSKDRAIMCLVRNELVITCLRFNILFQAQHIPGKAHVLADHLSRLQVSAFLAKAPSASRQPEAVPPLPHLPV